MPVLVYRISAFTADPFAGNPAVVCLMDAPADDAWMQAFAREMNVSETAFAHAQGDDYRLRWFTPTTEVRICGHATLATTHVLRETGRLAYGETARYDTLSGLLTGVARDGLLWLDFPARPTRHHPYRPGPATGGQRADSPPLVTITWRRCRSRRRQ